MLLAGLARPERYWSAINQTNRLTLWKRRAKEHGKMLALLIGGCLNGCTLAKIHPRSPAPSLSTAQYVWLLKSVYHYLKYETNFHFISVLSCAVCTPTQPAGPTTQNMDNIQAKLEQKGFVRGRNVEPVTRLLGQSSSTQSVLTRAELTRQQWKVIDLEQQRKQWEGVDLRRLILL